MNKADLKSMNLTELTEFISAMGEKPYRAKQIYQWLHKKYASGFDEMSDLPAALRSRLAETCVLTKLTPAEVQVSKLDGTRKYLFVLPDGSVIESVMMQYQYGRSVCISSQAGCRMGCKFCASATGGLVRSLRPSEMLEQVYRIGEDCGERISHVVVMGIGEPLDNFDSLVRFIELLTDANGKHMGQRNITVSTCGIVPNMRKLADKKLQITLALSLHAPTQEKRVKLMPAANEYPLDEVMDACSEYFTKTGRRITYEYSLIRGVNDTEEDGDQLCRLLAGRNCHVNLIPVNPVRERAYKQPNTDVIESFKNKLEKNGINVTIRRELGRDIDGACGQLRKRYLENLNID